MIKNIIFFILLYLLNISQASAEIEKTGDLTENQLWLLLVVIVSIIIGASILERFKRGENIIKWVMLILGGIPATIGLVWYSIEEQSIIHAAFAILVAFGVFYIIKDALNDKAQSKKNT